MALPLVTASGYIKAGRLMVRDRKSFDSAVSGLKDGWEVELEVTRLRATRSQQANRYYWGVVIKALADRTGYTSDEIHELMKAKFLPKELAILNGNGDVVDQFVLGGSTRSLDTVEFYEYVERVREWAGTELEIYIPVPDEHGYGI
jgi:hypothetical protein